MILDLLQYFLYDFWNFKEFTKSGPSEPVFITHVLLKIQDIWEHSYHILFSYLRISVLGNFRKSVYSF